MELSMIIYLAGVAGNLQGTLVLFAIGLALGGGSWMFITAMNNDIYRSADEAAPFTNQVRMLAAGAVLSLSAALMPSAQTVYMMLAADIAETQITSEAGQEVIGKLRDVVMQKLEQTLEDEQ